MVCWYMIGKQPDLCIAKNKLRNLCILPIESNKEEY